MLDISSCVLVYSKKYSHFRCSLTTFNATVSLIQLANFLKLQITIFSITRGYINKSSICFICCQKYVYPPRCDFFDQSALVRRQADDIRWGKIACQEHIKRYNVIRAGIITIRKQFKNTRFPKVLTRCKLTIYIATIPCRCIKHGYNPCRLMLKSVIPKPMTSQWL